ncbi:MAG: hypothetical protein WGN25_17400 [Candidatus Electrothrix sp. GW3-4]|uniref:hypothetical protein n=1 Tax=Candidatus Electrothrix sp. GW3-4 TaxID=3126740 RepID=UPI0030D3E0E2
MSRREEASAIIHTAAALCAATAGAFAQGATVGADTPALIAIQTKMVKELAGLFDHKIVSEDILNYLIVKPGEYVGVQGAKALLGMFPGIGNLANAGITFTHPEALGWAAYKYFKE